MSHYIIDIKTPAQAEAQTLKADYSLSHYGFRNLHNVYWNLPAEALYEEIVFRSEGSISNLGPVVVDTGKHTARAANDKFVVKEASTEGDVWWGEYNRPYSLEKFNAVYQRLLGYMQGRDLFVRDCYAGADPNYRLPEYVHPAGDQRRTAQVRARFHGHRSPVVPRHARNRQHQFTDVYLA